MAAINGNGITGNRVLEKDDMSPAAQAMILQRLASVAFQAVLKLRIPDILAAAKGKSGLSAEEILQELPTKSTPGPASVQNLQRLLAPLVRTGMFSGSRDDDKRPVYGLTDISRWFLSSTDLTLLPTAEFALGPVMGAAHPFLHESILDETTTAFTKAHGVSAYEYPDPEFINSVSSAMESMGNVIFRGALQTVLHASVLDGVKTLVDVGGCRGQFVAQVAPHKPQIEFINFDLPQVIATAPALDGVKHVAGSFFDSVPSGDACFLKWIIHNYGDEQCILILKNCWKALPKNGKVIICELIYDTSEKSDSAALVEYLDLQMMVGLAGARERTKEEYEELLAAAGFARSNFIDTPGSLTLIEGFKE